MSQRRTAYRTRFPMPELAVELPSAIIHLDLLSIHGGTLTLNTTAARIIDMLRDGLRDLELADLTRIAELNHLVTEEVRERQKGE